MNRTVVGGAALLLGLAACSAGERAAAPATTVTVTTNLGSPCTARGSSSARTWKRPGAKEQAIRDQLGLTPTRYMQLLNRLIDQPGALAYDPVTVNRLRRLREQRRAGRALRRLGAR